MKGLRLIAGLRKLGNLILSVFQVTFQGGDFLFKTGLFLTQKRLLRLECHCGAGSFKSQFKKADKSGAPLALILGEEEMEKGVIGIKFLREQREQQQLVREQTIELLATYLAESNANTTN